MMLKKLIFAIIIMVCAVPVSLSGKAFTLVIDAGHGGKDTGAPGSFSKEKDVALKVALAFGRYVENNCPDVKVIYTRKTDVFIPLQERANIANRNKADLFVSIHCNALPGGKISRGMETYTLGMHRASDNLDVAMRENEVILYEKDYKQRYAGFDPRSSESYIMFELMQDNNMKQSVEMARLVQQKVCAAASRPNKGVKQAGFLVLRETSMPSCLIELGFITTPDEERMLNSASGIDALGRGIYQAFTAYKRGKGQSAQVPYKQNPRNDEASLPKIVPEKQEPAEAKAAPKTEAKATPKAEAKPEPQTEAKEPPVFKVQILASDVKLKTGSPLLKGQKNADFYQENKMYKYTVGASANYSEIYALRKSLLTSFPEAFIIAFRGYEKMDVVEAIREYKANKNKR